MKDKAKLGAALLLAAGVTGCDIGCGNEVISSIASPAGTFKAIVFNRNCGATTGFNTQVSVVPANTALPSEAGNALILNGTVPIEIKWASESALVITGLGAARILKQQVTASGVSVSYGR